MDIVVRYYKNLARKTSAGLPASEEPDGSTSRILVGANVTDLGSGPTAASEARSFCAARFSDKGVQSPTAATAVTEILTTAPIPFGIKRKSTCL